MPFEREDRTEKNNVLLRFFVYAIGVFVLFSAFIFMVNLQSSINIHDGVGTKGLALMYISSIGFGLLCTPVLIQKFGSKVCLVASETAYLVYIVANYYPTAVLLGAAESMLWPCITMYNVHYGTEYSKNRQHPTKTIDYFINRLSGYFFVIHHSTQVFGSLIAIAIFSISNISSAPVTNAFNTTELIPMTSATSAKNHSYINERCGANDCQRVDVVDKTMENYSPASWQQLIILISCFAMMCIVPQIVHAFMLPVVNAQKPSNKREREKDENENCSNLSAQEDCVISEQSENNIPTVQHRKEGFCDSIVFQTLKQVGRQFLIPKQLLILPISLYEGLLIGFVLSELPRSYVACVDGFTKIGYYTCLFGFGRACLSFTISKKGKRLGRTRLFSVALLLDIANLLFCLSWVPNKNSSWAIYLVFLFFGFSDGIWEPLINVMYTEYFPDKHYIAGTLWAVMMHIGMGTQFALSTSLCVHTKIYILLGMLVVGFISYCVAERLHNRDIKKRQQEMIQDIS